TDILAPLRLTLRPPEFHLNGPIEAQRRAEEGQASQQSLRAIQRAFREALLALPPEEYDWFDIQARARTDSGSARSVAGEGGRAGEEEAADLGVTEPSLHPDVQRQF